MPLLRKSELKNMSIEDMKKKIIELSKELMKLRAQIARGTPPENPGKVRAIRKAIARLLTFINLKKAGGAK